MVHELVTELSVLDTDNGTRSPDLLIVHTTTQSPQRLYLLKVQFFWLLILDCMELLLCLKVTVSGALPSMC